MIKTYSELIQFKTFEERFKYLQIKGNVGEATFGFERYLNQLFYKSPEWKKIRDVVIIRDGACDLAVEGREIYGKVIIHHLNPVTPEDVCSRSDYLLNPEYLITTTHMTHNAIHYGDESLLIGEPNIRSKNDTCPWRLE